MFNTAREVFINVRDWTNESTPDIIKQRTLLDWVHIASLAGTLTSWVNNAAHTYKNFNTLDDNGLRRLHQERDSAAVNYSEANKKLQEGSLGAALRRIDVALDEFSKTMRLRANNVEELASAKIVYADMLRFKGITLFYLDRFDEAIISLRQSLELIPEQPIVVNILAFIAIYHPTKKNLTAAKRYVVESLELNSTQIFANFYHAMLNDDYDLMQQTIDGLVKISQLREVTPKNQWEQIKELHNLEATSLDVFVLYITVEWINVCTKRHDDLRTLSEIANCCGMILQKYDSAILKKCAGMFLESRFNALMKIAKAKSTSSHFSEYDYAWQKSYGLLCVDPKEDKPEKKRYFFKQNVTWLDHATTKLFPSGADPQCLKADAMREKVGAIIAEWAKSGWLSFDTNTHIKKICSYVKELKHKPDDEETKTAIKELCKRKEDVIDCFVATCVVEKGWRPWFRVAKKINGNGAVESISSLLHIICETQGINLSVYSLDNENNIKRENDFSQTAAAVRKNAKRRDQPFELQVLLNENSDEFSVLHELNTTSRMYRLIALADCWSLLEKDPNNSFAWNILSNRGLAIIPVWAQEELLGLRKKSSSALIYSQLKTAITKYSADKYRGESQNDKIKTQFILLISHCQRKPISSYSVAEELKSIIESKQQPFSDCARVLKARLYLHHVVVEIGDDPVTLDTIIPSAASLTEPAAKALLELVSAEVKLRGFIKDADIHRPSPNEVMLHIKTYLKMTNVIADIGKIITPECLSAQLDTAKSSLLLSFGHGYASSLLVVLSNTAENFDAYRSLCVQFGFWNPNPVNVSEQIHQITGCPLCLPELSKMDFIYGLSDTIGDTKLKKFMQDLNAVLIKSKLVLSIDAYVRYTLTISRILYRNAVSDERPQVYELRECIAEGNFDIVEGLLLRFEKVKPLIPFEVDSFDYSKLKDKQQKIIRDALLYLNSVALHKNQAELDAANKARTVTVPNLKK